MSRPAHPSTAVGGVHFSAAAAATSSSSSSSSAVHAVRAHAGVVPPPPSRLAYAFAPPCHFLPKKSTCRGTGTLFLAAGESANSNCLYSPQQYPSLHAPCAGGGGLFGNLSPHPGHNAMTYKLRPKHHRFGGRLARTSIAAGERRRRSSCITSQFSSLSDDADVEASDDIDSARSADTNNNDDADNADDDDGGDDAQAAAGWSSEAVGLLDDEALGGSEDEVQVGDEERVNRPAKYAEEEDEDADFQYFDDEDDDVYNEDGFEFDESALGGLELLDEEQEAILNELELAEDLGMLDDDEFLMKIDDDLVIKAKRVSGGGSGDGGDGDDDDGFDADYGDNGEGGGDGALLAIEELELAGAFDEDGKDYRTIDDDTLLEILGLPDEQVGIDEAIALDEEEEIVFRATDRDLKKAQQYLDDVFEEQSRAAQILTTDTSIEIEPSKEETQEEEPGPQFSFQPLESALELGVVPTEAGVGSGALPGDFGFDPFGFSEKDWFKQAQKALLGIVPDKRYEEEGEEEGEEELADAKQQDIGYDGGAIPKSMRIKTFDDMEMRPPSLIIRDYREAEIRHGRLAMLAAIFWPLQELVDRAFLPDSFGHTTFVYGGPTLPFFPLLMTFIMLNLGYLDIFASEIKKEEAGDAFEPGDVFWDPLAILQDAPPSMRRNFQQRELFNGRIAMLAVACFFLEEALTHKPLITGRISQFLFEPAYEVPEIQAFFDSLFGSQGASPVFVEPDGAFNPIRVLLEEEADKVVEAELSGGGTSDISQSQTTLEPFSMRYNK